MYVLFVRLRGGVRVVTVERAFHDMGGPHGHEGARTSRRDGLPSLPERFVGTSDVWLVFTTEYCAVCPRIVERISNERPGERVVTLDVSENLDLASVYKVRRAPTVLRASADGVVLARLSGADAVLAELEALGADTTLAV